MQSTAITFQINNCEFYVSFVNVFINDNIKLLENIELGFKRKIYWNKYRSEMKNNENTIKKPKNNNLNCLINPAFNNVNRLLVL